MKKRTSAYFLFALFIAVGCFLGFQHFSFRQETEKQQVNSPQVQCFLSENRTIVLQQTVSASTAFEALKKTAEKEKLHLQTKQYDFGVFVEGVGDLVSTSGAAWIYSVNGEKGVVASDQYILSEGDAVSWNYEEVSF